MYNAKKVEIIQQKLKAYNTYNENIKTQILLYDELLSLLTIDKNDMQVISQNSILYDFCLNHFKKYDTLTLADLVKLSIKHEILENTTAARHTVSKVITTLLNENKIITLKKHTYQLKKD